MKIAWRPYLAEFIATFTLIFVGAGSVCLDVSRGGIFLTGIALAHGLAIFTMVCATAHISGAHINPAVTAAVWFARKISNRDALGYIVAQLFGAIFGAWALKCIYPSMPALLGTPSLMVGLSVGQGIFTEAAMTFLLVFVIFATAIDPRGAKQLAPLAIGFTITMDILMGGHLTGAAINPARAFGPAFVSGSFENHYVYWVGPILGALLASFIYKWIFLKEGK